MNKGKRKSPVIPFLKKYLSDSKKHPAEYPISAITNKLNDAVAKIPKPKKEKRIEKAINKKINPKKIAGILCFNLCVEGFTLTKIPVLYI